MSRAGDCYDNAVAESSFASLKKEYMSRKHFATYTEAYDAIAAYIDGFYNSMRKDSVLGYVSPIDHSTPRHLLVQVLAAPRRLVSS